MFDDLKIDEWWFLGIAAAAGFLIVRHIIGKFADDVAATGDDASRSGGGVKDQRGPFTASDEDFETRGTSQEQSAWFRRGKDEAEQGSDQNTAHASDANAAAGGAQKPPPPRPWYQVLEVSSVATLEDVKRAYQRKIRQYHPDKVAGLGPEFEEMANTKAQEINRAYEQGCKACRR